ncbi:hypothetical protein B0H21DRAFT_726048 [Amylocystis lapponica]|nr:hypothetical protein B0H21DRAFT_726048 [Amylocystis lapponica]
MLSQKPEETGTSAADAAVSAQNASGDDAAVQALMEVIQGDSLFPLFAVGLALTRSYCCGSASPEFHMANDFSEYLTSPMDDSPWDDFLTTPAIGSADMASDLLTSPAIVDTDDFNSFGGVPLFADRISLHGAAVDTLKAAGVAPSAQGIQGPPFNFDDMYRMPSPSTPALDPASLGPSPRLHSVAPPNSASGRRKKEPTGTRKNVTPETLVPYDAPIQTRKYVTPSATSRKEVPAVFAKKRSRSQAFGDEEDQLLDRDSLAPSDVDAIEAKRRQNTLAARRSRKRKLEYQRELEQGLEQEKEEKEMWKSKAVTYAALLRSHGIEVPGL